MLSAFSAMIPIRPTVLCAARILAGFAAGWYCKPAPAPGTPRQGADAGSRRTGLPTSLAGRPVGTAGETWLDAAAADAAAVRGAARSGKVNQVLLEKLGTVLTMTDPVERLARWQALLPLMGVEDAGAIRAMLRQSLLEGHACPAETAAFFRRCGQMSPGIALAWAQVEGEQAISDVLGGWACRDSAAAVAWLKENAGGLPSEPGAAVKGLVSGLAAQSPETAAKLLQAHAEDPLFSPALGMATDFIIQSRGIAGVRQWFSKLADSGALALFKTASLETLLSYGDNRAGEFGLSRRKELVEIVAPYAGEPWFSQSAAHDLGGYMGYLDPMTGTAVMERFQDEETRECFMDTFLLTWFASDAALLTEWLERNPANPSFDAMVCRLANLLAKDDLDAARIWAARITDPVQREGLREVFFGTQDK
ncbi:MAG: hypothetical protein JWM59_880 [Verrucomicrobiales bacterium]|nr:hypothetical protein [Verrucomicrobiales bacterium]